METDFEIYKFVREEIKREHDLVNIRMRWHQAYQMALIAISVFIVKSFNFSVYWIVPIFLVGVFSAINARTSIRAARKKIDLLHEQEEKLKIDGEPKWYLASPPNIDKEGWVFVSRSPAMTIVLWCILFIIGVLA